MIERDLVLIFEVLDFKCMCNIVDVFEVKMNYKKFLEYFLNLKWYIVCYFDVLGFWVDFIFEGNEMLI